MARAEWVLRGMFTPLPTTYPSAKCGTLMFWSSFKGREKKSQGGKNWEMQTLVTKVAVLAGGSCVEGLVQPGVFQPKCSSVSDTPNWKLFLQ